MFIKVWELVGMVFGVLLIVIMIAIIWAILSTILFGSKKEKKKDE